MKTIRVVAAVIHADGKIFATQRGYGEYKDGWEFPGGKIEAGETPEDAIKREIREELDTEISVEELIDTIEYDYPNFHLSMDCFWCEIVSGDIVLKEHEAAKWLDKESLYSVDWLPTDVSVIKIVKDKLRKWEEARNPREANSLLRLYGSTRVFPDIIDTEIAQDVKKRGITRLCHVTPMENLCSILSSEDGIFASVYVPSQNNATAVDEVRLDGHKDYVCCSIQYPNYRFMQYKDITNWVVFFISPEVLYRKTTLYCEHNAASGYGQHIGQGWKKYNSIFGKDICRYHMGYWSLAMSREDWMPDWMPTYDQAEVMPYHNIEKSKIIGIVFKSHFDMEKCRKLLIEQGITYPKLIVSQGMFEDVREQYRTSKTLPEEIVVDNGNYI